MVPMSCASCSTFHLTYSKYPKQLFPMTNLGLRSPLHNRNNILFRLQLRTFHHRDMKQTCSMPVAKPGPEPRSADYVSCFNHKTGSCIRLSSVSVSFWFHDLLLFSMQ